MAIKIKNEGSAASRIAAKADGGRAKRAMEAAAFAKGRDIQQKQAATAHASAPSISAAPVGHAQLIGAPGAAPLGHAPSAGGLGASARFGGSRTAANAASALPIQRGGKIETQTPRHPQMNTVAPSRSFDSGSHGRLSPISDPERLTGSVGAFGGRYGGAKTAAINFGGKNSFRREDVERIQKMGGRINADGTYYIPPQSVVDNQSVRFRKGSGGSSGGGTSSAPMKTTASGRFNDPKDGSTYNPNTDSWSRPYLPGEYEAEARERIGRVENDLYADRALTAQGQKERAALVNDITTAIRNGKFSKEEQAQLMKEYGIADENIRMADALRDRDLTPEEQFRKNTYTDKNGIIFSADGTMLYNPQDAEMRREAARNARDDKYITQMQNFVASLENPITVTEMVDGAAQDQNGDPIPGPVKVTRFLTDEEKDAALKRYMTSLSQFWTPQGGKAQPQAQAQGGAEQPQAQAQGGAEQPQAAGYLQDYGLGLGKFREIVYGKEPPAPDWLNPQTPEIGPNGPRASVPGFTPVSGQGKSPTPAPQAEAPQAEAPTQEDDGEDYSEYQED